MDTEKKRKVLSIVVPAYNVERYLDDTLESFVDEKILADVEIIVVDDGSGTVRRILPGNTAAGIQIPFFWYQRKTGDTVLRSIGGLSMQKENTLKLWTETTGSIRTGWPSVWKS